MSSREVDSRRPSLLQGLEARWIGIGIAATAWVTDLAAKAVGVATLAEAPIALPGPLDLRLVLNSGVAFGMGSRLPSGLVLAVTAAVTVGIGVMLWRGRLPALAGGLILGGAIANVVDRMGDGAVVDLLDRAGSRLSISPTCGSRSVSP